MTTGPQRYPDCSLEFVEAMNRAIVEGTGGELCLEAPFVTWSKADIVREGLALGVPYELTWSCYEGGEAPAAVAPPASTVPPPSPPTASRSGYEIIKQS